MDAVVSMDVHEEWVDFLLHQKPDDLNVAVVTRPMQWCVSTGLGRVGHSLKVVDFFAFISFSLVFVLVLLSVFQVSLVFNEKAHNIFISVTCSPQDRVPAILFGIDISSELDGFLDSFKVVLFDSFHQHLVFLLLGDLLLFLTG